jgi:hypothetical protein
VYRRRKHPADPVWILGTSHPTSSEVERAFGELLSPFAEPLVGVEPGVDWRALAQLAGRPRLGGTLAAAIRRRGLEETPPHAVQLLLEAAWKRERERNTRFRSQLVEAIAALNAADLVPVPLKGAHDLLERPAEVDGRRLTDLDLLVPIEALDDAAEVLSRLGYRQTPGARAEHFGHQLPSFHLASMPGAIELHRELATGVGARVLPASEVLASAEGFERERVRYRLMSDEQRLAYAVMHAQIADRSCERFELPLRAVDDFVRLAYRSPGFDAGALFDRFDTHGAAFQCGVFLTIAHRLFAWPWPFESVPRPAWDRHLRRVLRVQSFPAGIGRSLVVLDELRTGFSRPVLAQIYPERAARGVWAMRLHHAEVLVRKYRGRYLDRLTGRFRY